ncbi:MAG TPA: zf-HC2 domain-containing protein [Candidatus Dormibacteraeota bacterium]|nr:zf-HC2 domain-containing protein [Candidatus Dormibacteraeota bacterium]
MTTCREARPLLPLFFDGELEARQMRAVALHSTRCPVCEHELRELEHLQEVVVTHVSALVDTIDVSQVWAGVAPRLTGRAPSWSERLAAWWEESRAGWRVRGPAFAGLAAAALLAVVVVQRSAAPVQQAKVVRPKIDNSAKLDSMQSSVDSVALVTEPETNTTMLWIMDDTTGAIGHVADDMGAVE